MNDSLGTLRRVSTHRAVPERKEWLTEHAIARTRSREILRYQVPDETYIILKSGDLECVRPSIKQLTCAEPTCSASSTIGHTCSGGRQQQRAQRPS